MKKIYFLLLTVLMTSASFAQVIITEIADPDNNSDARYIELHNLGASTVDFTEGNGWQIDKYTNASGAVSVSLDLTGSIPAGGFYIIAYDNAAGTFATVYGMTAHQLDSVNNGVAGSNGDDDLVLIDGTDTIVDFWGVYDTMTATNTDNSGTCSEYEDGRAERLTTVTMGSTTFNEAEWNVWADSDVTGCTSHVNAPRTAPGDFDPGAWGTPTCGFSFTNSSAICDAITNGADTYTATIDFSGGGNSSFTVVADAGSIDLSAGDPAIDETGTITITGLTEGVDVTITANDTSLCNVMSTITAATCVPSNVLPISDDFTYADGSLVPNGFWLNNGGTAGDFLVSSGQAVVEHGAPSEDVIIPFTPVSGKIYYGLDFTVEDPGAPITGSDFEYFAHFKDSGFGFKARLDIVEATSGGDFTVGISTGTSTAEATWAADLSFGTTYRAIVMYDQDANIAQLWIDATAMGDTSIVGGDDADPGSVMEAFQLRQSDSSTNETVLVDNLVISQNFADTTLSTKDYNNNTFAVYPNPVTNGFVNISSTSNEVISVSVFDILGKQVINQTVNNNVLNVATLTSGIYILKLSQNGNVTTKKLVIK
ncbi:T9SS type A sorting domain-containing protein [Oceanihabitans sp. 2_MG-2023]|uniref:T9SS type A sorting domain-containing protein n=1 Tax=Oceanihabitans sp. 2_MG-2023 TaxID=3062661 RepID=UPI0026E29019|nr:T9SS type A sorting domain-containing protein [Oceanihabitans sp. 2_MG-2023]MDO6595489.1 T9SS type A sorting domain-containing protein [Oceanihabitans sp. 2_MG-2023]